MAADQDLLRDIIVKVGTMLSAGVDQHTVRFHVLTRIADANLFGARKAIFVSMVEDALKKIGCNIKLSDRQQNEDAETIISEILVEVGTMLAAGVDDNTIRFYVITHVSELSVSGLEKMFLLGSIERFLGKKGRDITLR